MSGGFELAWVAAFVGVLVWALRAAHAARGEPDAPVPRAQVALAAAVFGALALASAHVWGTALARDGMARIAGPGDDGHAPARARLFLRQVRVVLPDGQGTLGFSPDAALVLPRGYGLDESKRGWDIVRVSATGPQALRVDPVPPPEPTSTRVLAVARPRGGGGAVVRARLARRCARADASMPPAVLDGPGAIDLVLCTAGRAVAALVLERDLSPASAETIAVRVEPRVWTGARWRTHHVQIARGSLLQIGAAADAVPGATLWEVPAPPGRAELFFPPDDLLAPCEAWRRPLAARAAAEARRAEDDSICVLPFARPFGLEVRRLLPDLPSIGARSLWAAGSIAAPALVLLLALCARPRSGITRRRVASALALAWLSLLVAAVAVSRLLWAHRIDMLRVYESVGPRVVLNQLSIALVAATLAATAALLARERRADRRSLGWAALGWAALAWLGGLALAGLALRGDLGALPWGWRLAVQATAALAVGLAPAWAPRIERWMTGVGRDPWPAMLQALVAVGVAAHLARALAPGSVALKLGLAWLAVMTLYAALRAAVIGPAPSARRAVVTIALGAFAAVSATLLDPGVAAVIVWPGATLAALVVGHDARYADDALRRIASYRRHHAPLVLAQAAIVAALGAGVAVWAVASAAAAADGEPDALLSRSITLAALHLPGVAAALFAPAAVLAYLRAGARAAAPWAVAGLALAAAWLARGALVEGVLGASAQAADRVALVVDPAYALLRSETKFLSGITAWRETILPGAGASLASGQGYFGAQLLDPGVLLSVENDYFPVLLVREAGIRGLLGVALALIAFVAGLWLLAGARFRHGSLAQRARALAAAVLGLLAVYQPLASLGVLPLTGISWPGFGIDSPSDLWILVALALWIAVWDGAPAPRPLDAFDAELRGSRPFRRGRAAVAVAAAMVAVAGLLVLGRAAAFALRRPNPVDVEGRAVAPFDKLSTAVDYAYQLQCPWSERAGPDAAALVPVDLLADPRDPGARRYHARLIAAWDRDRSAAVDAAQAFLDGDATACRGRRGAWRLTAPADAPGACELVFKAGWPEVRVALRRGAAGQGHAARCEAAVETGALRQLQLPVRRPYRDARIRLVSRAMGVAARDAGELVSGSVAVRLRPGAGEVDVSAVAAGLYAGERVRIAEGLSVRIAPGGRAVLVRERAEGRAVPRAPSPLVFLRAPDPGDRGVAVVASDERGWRLLGEPGHAVPLDDMALLVVGAPDARSLWMFRPPSAPPGAAGATVGALLADDIASVQDERRRYYPYGNSLPLLGWVNPYARSMSLGLDGWVRAALAEFERAPSASPRTAWRDGDETRAYCATGPPAAGADDAAAQLSRVCAPSPLDGVLECRVALQPELAIRMQHLTELIALGPERFAPERPRAVREVRPVRAAFTLMRGDTGEIVATGEFVPGRASSAYAPATPQLEQHLIRLREDRDPVTGRRLPARARGEASAEKIDLPVPVAVGSTMKPVLARALEQTDPAFAAGLVLRGTPQAAARCRALGTHAVLGHCPPTDSLWNRELPTDIAEFIADSANWFQAAIGLLGTALPRGAWGFGEVEAPADPAAVAATNVGAHAPDAALWTRQRGREVVSASGWVDLAALRSTPMWQRFERLWGRPLCVRGGKRACRRADARKDLCAARALPIEAPTADLRHLIALGPASFDFYPPFRGPDRRVSRVRTTEYLQFLRGSGLHPLGSLAQLTDAFNRLVFEHARDPARDGGYRLAASWFPVAPVGVTPPACNALAGEPSVRAGLCDALRSGTARPLAALFETGDLARGVEVYAAKTGTVDSLADVAENPVACAAFNAAHTVPDGEPTAAAQPYWLTCRRTARAAVNDSLVVVSFGVRTSDGATVPLTLGLRFQRSGPSLAAAVAHHYAEVARAYFGGSPSSPTD